MRLGTHLTITLGFATALLVLTPSLASRATAQDLWQYIDTTSDAFTKADVRAAAHALGLSMWDKPAAACLSSRIPRGVPITVERLRRVEAAEAVLQANGFRHVRVRDHGDIARIEVAAEEFSRLRDAGLRGTISAGRGPGPPEPAASY